MAVVKSYGFDPTTTTEITGFKPFLISASELVLKEDEPNSVVVEAKASSYDRPERWTFGATPIRDIYRNQDVAVSAKPVTSRGVQVLVKYNGFVSIEDSADPDYLKLIPVSAHTVVQVPINQYISASDILMILRRQTGALFEDTSATSARIDELIRSALRPTV